MTLLFFRFFLAVLLVFVLFTTVIGLIRLTRALFRSEILRLILFVAVIFVLIGVATRSHLHLELPVPRNFSASPVAHGEAGRPEASEEFPQVAPSEVHAAGDGRASVPPAGNDGAQRSHELVTEAQSPTVERSPPSEGTTPANSVGESVSKQAQQPQNGSGSLLSLEGQGSPSKWLEDGKRNAEEPTSLEVASSESEHTQAASKPGGISDLKVWVGREPFYGRDKRTLFWPVTLGPYLMDDEPLSLAHVRARLSPAWFQWLVVTAKENLPEELTQETVSARLPGSWNRKSDAIVPWVPRAFLEELHPKLMQIVTDYWSREKGRTDGIQIPLDWFAENLVKDIRYQIWTGGEVNRAASPPAAALGAPDEPLFQVHLLLAFSPESSAELEKWAARSRVERRVYRLSVITAGLLSILGVLYTGLRVDLALKGRRRRAVTVSMGAGILLILAIVFRLVVGAG